MEEENIDILHWLKPDYLRLILDYQQIEDYLFQKVYHQQRQFTFKKALAPMKYQNIHEMRDMFIQLPGFKKLTPNDQKKFEISLSKTISARNYYVHQFFDDLFFKAYNEDTGDYDQEKLDDLDFHLQDELGRVDKVYDNLLVYFGDHIAYAQRNGDLSHYTLSLTHAHLNKEASSEAHKAERQEKLPEEFWKLSDDYSSSESLLYEIITKVDKKYHCYPADIANNLHTKSFGEYGKLLSIATNKEPMFNIFMNDHIRRLNEFLERLNDLQIDRNYWIHFSLKGYLHRIDRYDFDAYCADVDIYNRIKKSRALASEMFNAIFELNEALK